MKITKCPKCGCTEIGDRWVVGRKLQYYCYDEDCRWEAEPRTPTKQKITDTKELCLDEFPGWDYILYDKYGHVSVYSRSYDSEKAAMKELEAELAHNDKDDPAAPYTGVLFKTPISVTLRGKMFTRVKGVTIRLGKD